MSSDAVSAVGDGGGEGSCMRASVCVHVRGVCAYVRGVCTCPWCVWACLWGLCVRRRNKETKSNAVVGANVTEKVTFEGRLGGSE